MAEENEIKEITTEDLCRMNDREGLILQGCGGDLREWVDGINDTLTEAGILLNGSRFKNISSFRHDGLTCLLFDFDGAELDVGKLAMWRLQTHGNFGGTWLSDYVPNRLGGYIHEAEPKQERIKPDCELIGKDGNIFNLIGTASATLRSNGMAAEAKEMSDRIWDSAPSYDEALNIISEFVNITGTEEPEMGMGMSMGF